jgi:hypothetical protein
VVSEKPDPQEGHLDSQHTLCSTGTEVNSPQPATAAPSLPAPVKLVGRSSRPEQRSKGVSKVERAAREQLLFRFLDWVFAEVVVKLIGACFYATEVEGRGSEVLYYRKPVWARIVNKGKQQLFANFVPVSYLICAPVFVGKVTGPMSPFLYFSLCVRRRPTWRLQRPHQR